MSRTRRKGSTLKNFIAHSRELRESYAWQALPDNARRVLDRLEVEHMRHAGSENGRLPCTYSDFVKAGLRRNSISLAIRQCVALGFVEVTRRGGRSIADVRPPSLYRLTHVFGRKDQGPTDEWRLIKCPSDASVALEQVAQERNHDSQAARPATKKPKKAGGENDTLWSIENDTPGNQAAGGENDTPGPAAKTILLSIFSGEGVAGEAVSGASEAEPAGATQ